jgi:hypothetical protein
MRLGPSVQCRLSHCALHQQIATGYSPDSLSLRGRPLIGAPVRARAAARMAGVAPLRSPLGSLRSVFGLPRGPSLPSGNQIAATVASHSNARRVGVRQRNTTLWGGGRHGWPRRGPSPAIVRVATVWRRAVIGVQDRAGQTRRAQQHRHDQQIWEHRRTAGNEYRREREGYQNRHQPKQTNRDARSSHGDAARVLVGQCAAPRDRPAVEIKSRGLLRGDARNSIRAAVRWISAASARHATVA